MFDEAPSTRKISIESFKRTIPGGKEGKFNKFYISFSEELYPT